MDLSFARYPLYPFEALHFIVSFLEHYLLIPYAQILDQLMDVFMYLFGCIHATHLNHSEMVVGVTGRIVLRFFLLWTLFMDFWVREDSDVRLNF